MRRTRIDWVSRLENLGHSFGEALPNQWDVSLPHKVGRVSNERGDGGETETVMGGSMGMRIKLGGAGAVTALLAFCIGFTNAKGLSADEQKRILVPLGGAVENLSGDKHFGVFIPTRFGGELTISTSDGSVESLAGPDGR